MKAVSKRDTFEGCAREAEIFKPFPGPAGFVLKIRFSLNCQKNRPHNWPKMAGTSKMFESTAETFKSDAWIVGRTTMEGFSSKKAHRLGKPDRSIPKKDFFGEHKTKTYAVVIDPSGKCRWDSNMVTTEHVIEVLTERVSTAYLKHLRDKQVSYIFAGRSEIDLAIALRYRVKN
jgi:hypothetical protein